MAHKGYEWRPGEPTSLAPHSLAKHEVLHDYLFRYIQVLAARPQQSTLRLTIVDGFAGGGLYRVDGTNEITYGSPIQLLRAADASVASLNLQRRNPFTLEATFFFVDILKQATDSLDWTLRNQGYGGRIGKDIRIINQSFASTLPIVFKHAINASRAARTLFLLDQYGYSDVPLRQIKHIFQTLPRAEVVLTIAADHLLNFLGSTAPLESALERADLSAYINNQRITEMVDRGVDRKFIVQSQLIDALVNETGANFFTPFFIRSQESNRAYWLVHLSNHYRAQDEMTKLHWEKQNVFEHRGRAGLRMLGYDPRADASFTGGLDFGFDQNALERTRVALLDDLPKYLSTNSDGMSFEMLLTKVCNQTPATSKILSDVMIELRDAREIEIRGPQGERRDRTRTVSPRDAISLNRQTTFLPRRSWNASP